MLVPLHEYLGTMYRPDRDYLDGELVERNLGERDHSELQTTLISHFWARKKQWGILVLVELRVQLKPSRFRIMDLCVLRGDPHEQILTHPPLICIEVLSPEDSMSSMLERIEDFVEFGVENVWILDPRRRKAYSADRSGIHEVSNGVLEVTDGSGIRVPVEDIWSQ